MKKPKKIQKTQVVSITSEDKMGLEQKTVLVAKECNDVMVFLVDLVQDIKAKKSAKDIAITSLPKLIGAIDGIEQIKTEASADLSVVLATVGYHSGAIAGVLVK